MDPVHVQVLNAAVALSGQARRWTFTLADVVRALPHLNPATVGTHVASRCCVNAPVNHQSRHGYFRAVGRGLYQVQPRYRTMHERGPVAWQDRLLERLESGVDATLIDESLKLTPTERLERMVRTARSLEELRQR